jgi:hypothetical protein
VIRLSELSDFGRKQLARKRKFALVNNGVNLKGRSINESGDVQIELTGKQVKELDTIFKEFDSDLNNVLQTNLEEKRQQPEYTSMSTSQLEDMGVVLKIDSSVMDGIDKLLELGGEAKGWYAEMNQKILEAFGDSDGTLFLILLAIFSPRNPLAQNFKLAAQTYHGIKKDLANEETKKRLEEMMEMKSGDLYKAMKEKDAFKDLASVRGMIKGNANVNTTLPNTLNLLRMYKRNNYVLTKKQAVDEISKHLMPSGALDKDTIVSAEKVFSFTLNLLDPTYQFESGWLPVTMDTWMASFFYPQLDKKEKYKLLAKTSNYVYMARMTQELAKKYNMEPVEFQAAIWVGKLKESEGENYDTTFLAAIDKNLKKLDIKIEELKKLDNFLAKVIEVIGEAGTN